MRKSGEPRRAHANTISSQHLTLLLRCPSGQSCSCICIAISRQLARSLHLPNGAAGMLCS